jgi:hypothetical protein
MSNLLKGNFKPKKNIQKEITKESLEDKFEREALANLGGSIGYVSRKSFIWNGDNGDNKELSLEGRAAQYDEQETKK